MYGRVRSKIDTQTSDIFGVDVEVESSVAEFKDNVVPEFISRSGRGEVFCNPMQKIETVSKTPISRWEMSYIPQGSSVEQKLAFNTQAAYIEDFLALPDLPELTDAVVSNAIIAANANVGADSLDVLATMGELRETIGTLANAGLKVAKIMRAVRKFNFRCLKEEISPSAIREKYLEFRYGLRPVYYDLRAVHDFHKEKTMNNRQTFRGKANEITYVTSVNSDELAYPMITSTDIYGYMYFTRSTWTEVSARAGVLTELSYDDMLSFTLAKLGIDRPLSSGWELVPFSFMIDWFVNIGDLIRSWEPKPHITERASWCTTVVTTNSSIQLNSIVPREGHGLLWMGTYLGMEPINNPISTRTSSVVTRVPNPTKPLTPVLDINLSSAKILDMAAIFSALAQSKLRQKW